MIKKRLGVVCLLFILAMVDVMPANATEQQKKVRVVTGNYSKGKVYVKADMSQMCPEEIALRRKLGMTADTPQLLSSDRPITTGTGLSIASTGKATCSGSVFAGDDVKTIQIFLYLQKDSSKETVASWMDSADDTAFGMTRIHQLTERGTYVVRMSAYVKYGPGSYDSLVRYSYTDTY